MMKKCSVTFTLFLLIAAIGGSSAPGAGQAVPTAWGLRAGFALAKITPPVGTRLSGFGDRDFDTAGARGVHDDLFVRALYLSQGKTEVLIMGFDLLFFSRDEADRFKGAVGDRLGLAPAQILLNASHTHTGPKVGNWYYTPSEPAYLDDLEKRIVGAAVEAKSRAAEATLWAGETRTSVPLSRRLKRGDGPVEFAPNPDGATYPYLPIVVLKGRDGKPICLLFSVACHPSTIKGNERASLISADYPGAACAEIDRAHGRPCALFLQGAGGDAKASVIGRGLDAWREGTWEDVALTGRTIAAEIDAACRAGLEEVRPDLRSALVEARLPLGPPPTRDALLATIEKAKTAPEGGDLSVRVRGLWAREEMGLLDRGFGLASEAPVFFQGIELGRGLRLIGVEGELTADLGRLIRGYYDGGTTLPLGYSNGARMYLPSSRMIREGGYEVESFWEYRQPAPLLEGVESLFLRGLDGLKAAGIADAGQAPGEAGKPAALPPDVPLPSLPANGLSWTRDAVILQPWGRSQWDAIVHAAERAPWLAKAFGFNAMIVLPPDAHNAISPPEERITGKEFDEALALYRANGFRIILYSSIMHCGHDPIWQDGTLARTHPEWSQRGPKGEPVKIYGQEWLCPSTGAAAFTLDYTAGLVRRYRPDLIMLDNSEFFETPAGVTCYCEGCQAAFRKYVEQRFGGSVEGRSTASVRIPTEPGFLYDVWLSFRNRVWGEANELFRRELRKVKPDIVVISNTQYLRAKPDLATDLIYDHEDALISESVGLTMDGMIDKLLLGKALAKGKPVWNYLGTFREEDQTLLVPPDAAAMNISTAYACGVRPWVVYYGFTEKVAENRTALEKMKAAMAWHAARKFGGEGLTPWAPVLSLVSLGSRNYRLSPIIPGHLTPLRRRGVASRIVEEKTVEEGVPASCRALIIEDAPCLSDRAVGRIAEFVRAGGLLIASPAAAMDDELGRPRPASALWQALGIAGAAGARTRVGRGEVVVMDFQGADTELAGMLEAYRITAAGVAASSVLPYTDAGGRLVVYVCTEGPAAGDLKLTVPGGRHGQAIVCSAPAPVPYVVSF